jgi:class 3 adenylate cyclase
LCKSAADHHLDASAAAGFRIDFGLTHPTNVRDMRPIRRLTAILAADVAGYSCLMGADEEGTPEQLKAHLQELVNPKVREAEYRPQHRRS